MVFVLLQCPAAFHAGSCEAEGEARRWGERGGREEGGGKRRRRGGRRRRGLVLEGYSHRRRPRYPPCYSRPPSLPLSRTHPLPPSFFYSFPHSRLRPRCLLHSYPGRARVLRCLSLIYTSLVLNCVYYKCVIMCKYLGT